MDPQALDLANRTLAAAMDALTGKGAPITPVVFVEKAGVREPRRVVAGKRDDATAIAKQLASEEAGADATAYAVDGAITYNGVRSKGIIVEAWNFRLGRGARIGLRYELTGTLRKKPSLLGSPLHLGRDGWFDPEDAESVESVEPPSLPEEAAPAAQAAPTVVPAPAPAAPVPDFGPPPTSAPVQGFAPPLSFPPPLLPPPAAAAPAAAAPSAAAPSAAAPSAAAPSAAAPSAAAPSVPAPSAAAPSVPAPSAAAPSAAPAPAPVPVLDTAPPSAAHPVDVVAAPAPAVAEYVPVPIQRNETPLGNRAMFAGIMELASRGRSFPAFAIVQKGGAWEQVTMTDASLADAAASVRSYASSRTDAEFIAFAIDGAVPVDGSPVPAVIVEVWEYATRVSFSVAQRYVPTGDPPSPRLSGRPLMRTQAGWIDVPSSMSLGGQVQFGYGDPSPA